MAHWWSWGVCEVVEARSMVVRFPHEGRVSFPAGLSATPCFDIYYDRQQWGPWSFTAWCHSWGSSSPHLCCFFPSYFLVISSIELWLSRQTAMGYEADACMYVCDTYLYSVYICMYRLMKMESYLSECCGGYGVWGGIVWSCKEWSNDLV